MRNAIGISLTTILCFVVMIGVAELGSSRAQTPQCSFFDLQTVIVNVRRDPAKSGGYIDVLEKGDIACVTEQRKVGDHDWAFIKSKTAKDGKSNDVGGWAKLRYMKPTDAPKSSASNSAVKQNPQPKKPATKVATKSPSATPKAATPKAAPTKPAVDKTASAKTTAAKSTPAKPASAVFRFNQPVPFGAYPVRGRTLEELAVNIPLFSPIPDLPDELWKRNCTSCHQWNKERLCEQGKSYLKAARHVLRHQHPYGGTYKLALMRWAKTGCQ